jgi:hypothetical protein
MSAPPGPTDAAPTGAAPARAPHGSPPPAADVRGRRERVADAHVVVEVRERRDGHRVHLVALDDDREPQPQLAQPHCRRVHVHAEDGAREHVAAHRRHGARVAACAEQPGDALERVHEERAGAARGVQQPQRREPTAQRGRGARGRRPAQRGVHVGVGECVAAGHVGPGGERGAQRLGRRVRDERLRRVERAGRAPLAAAISDSNARPSISGSTAASSSRRSPRAP